MNELIERYIYDVTRRLPEKERSEVKHELDASITDMLPNNPNEKDIMYVLTKLGAPRLLAEQYRQKPRYLISPAMYELYISVLKTVITIAAGIFGCIGALTAVSSGSVGEIIRAAISTAMEGTLQAVFWVTFGFAMTEHYGLKLKPWTVSDLPRLPDQKGVKISRSSSIVGMTLSVFFTALLIMMIVRDEWFFVLVRNSEVINPFSQAALGRSIPYLLLLGILGLAVSGAKFYWGRWNIPLCVINAAHNLIWVTVMIHILHWSDLFSMEFLAFAERTFTANADILTYIASGGTVNAFSALLILVAVIDTGVAGWSTWKGMREPT